MNKKLVNGLLAATLVAGIAAPAMAAPADVVGTDFESAVDTLSALKVLEGYPDGTFKPNNTITRAEFAAVVVRALGYNAAATSAFGTTTFGDVATGHWASGYINVASSLKVINGIGNGQFAPDAPVKFEEAVTMLVRALGYEPAAQESGGYPNGYLVVAAQEDITEDVNGVLGLAAARGVVAQLLDNSLLVPKMIQVGYGDQRRFEQSAPANGGVKTILQDNLKVAKLEQKVVEIPRTDSSLDDNEIRLSGAGIVKVPAGFDAEALFGALANAYVNKDDLVIKASLHEDNSVLYDAITVQTDGDIELEAADKEYDVASNVVVYVDGVQVSSAVDADYAKVVLNEDGDVNFIDAFNWDTNFIVEKVEGEIAVNLDDAELDLEDYTIVKDGKTISASDLVKGDVVFYNATAEYAEVFNKTVAGKIDTVYANAIKVNGKNYAFDGASYVKSGDYATLAANDADDIKDLEAMQEEGDVALFLDRNGKVVLVSGDLGEVAKTSFYGLVVATAAPFDNRGTGYHTLDLLNDKGEVVKYDLKDSDITADDKLDFDDTAAFIAAATVGSVLKVTVDANGKVTKVESPTVGHSLTSDAGDDIADANTKKYIDGYLHTDSSVVFLTEDAALNGDETAYADTGDIKVTTWVEAKKILSTLEEGNVYVSTTSNKVLAMKLSDTDADADVDTFFGIVTAPVKEIADTNSFEIIVQVDGVSKTYVTDKEKVVAANVTALDLLRGEVISFDVSKTSGKIVDINEDDKDVTNLVVTGVNTTTKKINSTYTLASDAVVYNVKADGSYEVIGLSNIKNGDTVQLFNDENSSNFVKFVVRTALASDAVVEPAPAPAPETTTLEVVDEDSLVKADDKVVKVTIPADNTEIYSVKVFNVATGVEAGTARNVLATKEFDTAALDFGADGDYLVRLYNEAGDLLSGVVVTYDTTPPAEPVASPVDSDDTVVTGTAVAGATVTVYDDTTVLGNAVANADGNFSVTITAQAQTTVLTVSATDAAGNESTKDSVTVTAP
jgi:hypothetical protein